MHVTLICTFAFQCNQNLFVLSSWPLKVLSISQSGTPKQTELPHPKVVCYSVHELDPITTVICIFGFMAFTRTWCLSYEEILGRCQLGSIFQPKRRKTYLVCKKKEWNLYLILKEKTIDFRNETTELGDLLHPCFYKPSRIDVRNSQTLL